MFQGQTKKEEKKTIHYLSQ